ncbi:hypothetical protein GWO43_31335 [candidate division KSB1 bacterium]|nr:hypothetical protein [candidate division KSB1 bacterium]NIR73395.1 hypothetical protein [candidate division KSB1 bacterium]NIS28394.1 hypothetical protein [candidate division KSB1 bacterium]NIT75275.1 hypothetical protein [candidate division KSB1 bacterium]NIU29122.1 hypothetical protein [candidate division KSB1 bacterium]
MNRIVKLLSLVGVMTFLLGFAFQETSETEQLKSDLVGQRMGGRDKAWKFQSVDQIKDLEIKETKQEGQTRIYEITLKLQDARVPGAYSAEAVVTYEMVDSEWKLKMVGLKSMRKVE